jgi:hypothetical protein
MNALDKDRTRRYETANGFAMDIQRFLSGEPVLAAPPSARYRLRKVAGVTVSTWQAICARRAEMAAVVARRAESARAEGERKAKQEALAAAAAEKAAKEQAQKRLMQIQKANAILGSIFEDLNPEEVVRGERPLRAILVDRLDRAVEQAEPDDWKTFNTQSLLGGVLLGQKKYAEAEPLLLAGYEGMEARQSTIPPQANPRLTEALERLVQLYEALDKPDEAAKWRAELEAAKAANPPTTP